MRVILDTKALLKFFKGEKGGRQVQQILEMIEDTKLEGYVSAITLTEIYYFYFRKSKKIADEKADQLKYSALKIVPIEDQVGIQAGNFKGKYAIPITDSLIGATAFLLNAKVISDDPHFEKIKEIETTDAKTFLEDLSKS